MLADFFASMLPTAYAEEAQEEPQVDSDVAAPSKDAESEDGGEAEGGEEEEEEEEEEPEDAAPAIREECAESKACHSFKHHFEECAARVQSGKTLIENEDCVEELFHLMHCVDSCAAPKVFATLK